ncbi:MAG TPA: hypothetical protein VNY52_05905 [Solirubrobacteraceae bacterium]|jgi:hypothetical protein|nr:hypothetical protein [Solirubrobacteraceae bacterium]
MSKARVLIAVAVACVCLIAAAAAWAAETLTVTAGFSPDKLGAPTNVHGTAKIGTTTGGLPSPITKVTLMGPAGLGVDVNGVGTCNPARLQAEGPEACPKDSKAGFGGGEGALELAKQVIEEEYTLNLFRGPNENGHIVVLVYVNAVTPVSIQLVFKAQVVNEPKPYGMGFSLEVPLIPTLPEASDASVLSSYLTIGAPNAAFEELVHGKRKLVHIKGIIVPKTCPHGGFPYEVQLGFADGTTNTDKGTIPCPHK